MQKLELTRIEMETRGSLARCMLAEALRRKRRAKQRAKKWLHTEMWPFVDGQSLEAHNFAMVMQHIFYHIHQDEQ